MRRCESHATTGFPLRDVPKGMCPPLCRGSRPRHLAPECAGRNAEGIVRSRWRNEFPTVTIAITPRLRRRSEGESRPHPIDSGVGAGVTPTTAGCPARLPHWSLERFGTLAINYVNAMAAAAIERAPFWWSSDTLSSLIRKSNTLRYAVVHGGASACDELLHPRPVPWLRWGLRMMVDKSWSRSREKKVFNLLVFHYLNIYEIAVTNGFARDR